MHQYVVIKDVCDRIQRYRMFRYCEFQALNLQSAIGFYTPAEYGPY